MYTLGFYLGMVGYEGHVGFKGVRFRIQLTNIPISPKCLYASRYIFLCNPDIVTETQAPNASLLNLWSFLDIISFREKGIH